MTAPRGVAQAPGRLDRSQQVRQVAAADAGILRPNGPGDRLSGNDGDDTLKGGLGNDNLLRGDGADTLFGGEGNDQLNGGAGNDHIWGGLGNDRIVGGDGNDSVSGGFGDDRILGNDGNDILSGDEGNDQIFGGAGDDTIDGGLGNDMINGGPGQDTLTGGLGADTFVFHVNGDTTATVDLSTATTIADFSVLEGDRIQLSDMDADLNVDGNQAFSFLGDGGFSHTAGELRADVTDGNTYLYGDQNGDGSADFVIRLDGVVALQTADFVL